jgi:hypothetical protein
MQNSTHYTSTVQRSNGTVKVYRKAGNVHTGTMTRLHRGWEANFGAGVRLTYATKAEAFEALVAADLAVGDQGHPFAG